MNTAQLSQRLVKLRKDQGLSMAEVARCMDILRQRLNNWEKGRFRPNLDQFMEWADALGFELVCFPAEGNGAHFDLLAQGGHPAEAEALERFARFLVEGDLRSRALVIGMVDSCLQDLDIDAKLVDDKAG
jgi:transcriptional regulator with XRE-family HTH domain